MSTSKKRCWTILAAGGSGTRMNAGENKIFLPADGKCILLRSLILFDGIVDGMVIVCRPEDENRIIDIINTSGVSYSVSLTSGGDTRQHSVMNGLKAMTQADAEDIVLIHDAARCNTPEKVIRDVVQSCIVFDSGVAAVPAVNTMKYAGNDGTILRTVERNSLYEIQTPQGFLLGNLIDAYSKAERDGFIATDDASVMEHSGYPVHLVQGSKTNIKVTEKEDLIILNSFLQHKLPDFRIGIGYDVHRLTENRKLIICGIEIPHSLGLLGHSDADVGLHALMDAMLGAASLGDIGIHFPDTSDKYKDISSLILLEKTIMKIHESGYEFVNADITLIAQKPKLAPFIPDMVKKVSETLSCNINQINIKATTTEKLGFEGREEGISAHAICLLQRNN